MCSTGECDIKQGPEVVLAHALETLRAVMAEVGVTRAQRRRRRLPGPVEFPRGVPVSPPIMPGWDGYPMRDAGSTGPGMPPGRRQRRQRARAWGSSTRRRPQAQDILYVKIGTGIGCGLVSAAPSPRQERLRRATSVTSPSPTAEPHLPCGNTGCLEAFAGGAALAREATAAARAGRPLGAGAMLADRGDSRRPTSGRGRRRATPAPSS